MTDHRGMTNGTSLLTYIPAMRAIHWWGGQDTESFFLSEKKGSYHYTDMYI